jgi:hypothetical protein
MCYFLYIATPLTLSEVRSMLPPGLTAQPVGGPEAAEARRLFPTAQTVATLLVGGCSCDLVHQRDPEPREDERHLRARFSRLRLPREEIIRRLERHRRRPAQLSAEPMAALSSFVAEHARNAGPTLYSLRFGEAAPEAAAASPVRRTVADIRKGAGGWLEEGRPVLVVR